MRWIKRKSKSVVNEGFSKELNLFFVDDPESDARFYVSDKERLKLYRRGLQHRQTWILRDYCLDDGLLDAGDVVVDVGANVGDLGRWVEQRGGRYIGFEPDPLAYSALKANVTSTDMFPLALSDKEGTADFYLSTADADSSLFRPGTGEQETITVEVQTLDNVLGDLIPTEPIKLLKVEAEGMEPEILNGARESLKRVEVLAVDAGPERGGENTVPGVLRALKCTGFEVVACFLKRGTFLFRRQTD